VFVDDQTARAESLVNTSSGSALNVEEIEQQKVLVFQQRSESDLWTTFVTFMKPNVLVVATNAAYLQEALARLQGKNGPRALPETLPEWRYVNVDARFWGLRHYDRIEGKTDPSSPFFRGTKNMSAPWFDNEALGLTFSFDQATGRAPTITYLSGDPSIARAKRGPLSMGDEGGKLGIVYQDLDRVATEATYNVRDSNAAPGFFFVLSCILGHAIFL
jgi:hypothetical protein